MAEGVIYLRVAGSRLGLQVADCRSELVIMTQGHTGRATLLKRQNKKKVSQESNAYIH